MLTVLTPAALTAALSLRDLTDPTQGAHAMQLIMGAVVEQASKAVGAPVSVHRHNPIVTVAQNYDQLLIPATTATREARYTRYVSPTTMLRSHTSAHMPPPLG